MGLIAWYPLNGNLEDYSESGNHGVSLGTLSINSDGKIGNTYLFENNENGVSIQNKNFEKLKEYTMSAWINPSGNHRNYNGAIISSGNWNNSCWSFGVNQTNTQIDVAGRGYNKYIDYSIPLNTWTHILCTAKNNTTKLYVNGVYIGEKRVTSELVSDATNTTIGRETYLNGYFSFNGKINDVRIYDEILSLKEIKEIAKAKILHYNFNQFAESTRNIIPNPHIFSSGWTPYSNGNSGSFITEFGTEGLNIESKRSWCGAYRGITLPSVGTYTLSVWVKVISRTNSNINATLYTTGGGLGDVNVVASWDSSKIGQWQKIQMTRTYSTTSITLYLICYGGSNAEGYEISAQYTMPQIEAKPYSTEFVNGERIDRVKDSSGFRNHSQPLQIPTTPQWVQESILGSGAYKFNKTSSIIEATTQNFKGESYSISLWFNKLDSLYYQGVFQISNPRVMRLMGFDGNKMRFHPLGLNNGDKFLEFSYETNKWYNVVMTIDSTLSKLYVNGVKIGEITLETTLQSFNSKDILIGRDTSDNSRIFNGFIDDVRIYATTLSDEDIKELYQSKGSISKNGKLTVNEIVEIGATTHINKKGQLTTKEIIEIPSVNLETKTAYGADWVQLFYHNSKSGTVIFSSDKKEFLKCNTGDKISNLYLMELFRGKDGKFEFLLEYESGGTSYNRWKQTSNFTTEPIAGYEPIQCSWTVNYWEGLAPSSSQGSTWVDGSPNNGTWYYAIGSKVNYSGGMPPWTGVETGWVKIWVRCDNPSVFKMYKNGTSSATEFIEN